MTATNVNALFQWKCQPKAEALLLNILEECCKANPFIADLQRSLLIHTSTRLFDWVDHLVVGYSEQLEHELEEVGFVSDLATSTYRAFHHPGAQLPRIVLKDDSAGIVGTAVAVDQISDFLMVRGMAGFIEGEIFGGYRRCCVSTDRGVSLWVVERRGTLTLEPSAKKEGHLENYLTSVDLWKTRPRNIDDEDEAMAMTLKLADKIIGLVGVGMAAHIVLEVERLYWQAKNTAAQIQKNRQDRLGMGWANHDHHTFRSSRRHFSQLVRLFEMLGFTCRERFYAGEEASWGAQVMEHSKSRMVLFLDVDLMPNEIEIDFRHHSLPDLPKLGTVGLWCGLHGDSILQAGMHHLEAQFMFDDLKEDLAKIGVGMMPAFSDFPYLKQAFTAGERWIVQPKRVQRLAEKRLITSQQSEKFRHEGAIGSHLENLQRREGYKGFNQKNVSFIIQKTDPRNINF